MEKLIYKRKSQQSRKPLRCSRFSSNTITEMFCTVECHQKQGRLSASRPRCHVQVGVSCRDVNETLKHLLRELSFGISFADWWSWGRGVNDDKDTALLSASRPKKKLLRISGNNNCTHLRKKPTYIQTDRAQSIQVDRTRSVLFITCHASCTKMSLHRLTQMVRGLGAQGIQSEIALMYKIQGTLHGKCTV